jgi:hypothetical protein
MILEQCNNGAYAMSGESIKNSGVWDKLSNPQQNALDSKTNYSITTTFDKDGNLNDSIGVTAGVNVREDNSTVKNKDNIDSSVNRVAHRTYCHLVLSFQLCIVLFALCLGIDLD